MDSISHAPVKRLGPNTLGKIYVSTDVHGHFKMLEHMLERAGFDESCDWLILCGDLVDRGPESYRFLEFIHKPWLHAVMGNHEDFCRQSGLSGLTPLHLKSGGAWFGRLDRLERARIIDAIDHMPYAIDLTHRDGRRIGFVHAEVFGDDWDDFLILLENQETFRDSKIMEKALFSRAKIYANHTQNVAGVDQVFVGHTSLYEPVILGNTHFIDTGTCFPDGSMTLICLDDGRHFQCKMDPSSVSEPKPINASIIRDRSKV